MTVDSPRDVGVDVPGGVREVLDGRAVADAMHTKVCRVSLGCQSRPSPAASSTSLKRTFIRWREAGTVSAPSAPQNTVTYSNGSGTGSKWAPAVIVITVRREPIREPKGCGRL